MSALTTTHICKAVILFVTTAANRTLDNIRIHSGNKDGKFPLIRDVCKQSTPCSPLSSNIGRLHMIASVSLCTVPESYSTNCASFVKNLHRVSPSIAMCCNQKRTGNRCEVNLFLGRHAFGTCESDCVSFFKMCVSPNNLPAM